MKWAGLIAWLLLPVALYGADPPRVEVDFVNASRATRCAEEDNVYVKVVGEDIGRFRIRAEHPPYIARVRKDSTDPVFDHCNMAGDPRFPFPPRRVVLYEDAAIRLVGHTFETFWRPEVVDFRVGERSEPGLHLVQLVRRGPFGELEQLVVYPADGYWRVKPLPPRSLPDTAYGSSFLFGPIQEDGRPFVAIRAIAFDPVHMRFRLDFADGRVGTLRVVETSAVASGLEITVEPPLPAGQPFAALRSMYVTDAQADVAIAAWPAAAGREPATAAVLEFGRFQSASARFGRRVPSRHNLTAPDLIFDRFERAAPQPVPPAWKP